MLGAEDLPEDLGAVAAADAGFLATIAGTDFLDYKFECSVMK